MAPHDVFVTSVDGAVETPVVSHPLNDLAIGWSPAGDQLLFNSDRSGSMGLWSVPIRNGRPDGPPSLIKSDLSAYGMGLTRTGTLIYGFQSGATKIYVASMDFSTGKLLSSPREAGETYLSNHRQPAWSPDGRWLAFTSQGARGRPTGLSVLSLATGRVDETIPQTTMFDQMRGMSADAVVCGCAGLNGRQGIYKIDIETGAATMLVDGEGGFVTQPSLSPDGKLLLFTRTPARSTRHSIIVRELATGTERELARDALSPVASPDGRRVAYIARGPDDSSKATLNIIPIEGGTPRALAAANWVSTLVDWTPDGRRIVTNRTVGGKTVAMAVPVDGGAPVELALPADWRPRLLRVHPDGRQIAFGAGIASYEVWALENFLPARK